MTNTDTFELTARRRDPPPGIGRSLLVLGVGAALLMAAASLARTSHRHRQRDAAHSSADEQGERGGTGQVAASR